MNVLVVGAGMYVTGRKNSGIGTILASLAETSKTIPITEVLVVARSQENKEHVEHAVSRINASLQTALRVRYQRLGQEYLSSLNEIMRRQKFSIGVISVPDHLHYSYAKYLMEMDLHVLVVKPLTPTLDEAKDLVEIQRNKHVYAAVEFHKRYDESNLYVKKTIREKTLGRLLYTTVDFSQPIDVPSRIFRGWSEKSNIFQYLGVHYVDLIYFMTGYMPKKAMAVGVEGRLREMGINTFDAINATIVWSSDREGEMVSLFSTNWVDPACTSAFSDQKYKIIGTKGRIECDQKHRGMELVSDKTGIKTINPYFSEILYDPDGRPEFSGYGHKSIYGFFYDIQKILDGKKKPEDFDDKRPSFTQALVSSAVIDAVNKSLKNQSEWQYVDNQIES
jgi:predicted dehydrogenase